VDHFTKVRDEIKLSSGDYIDLKAYEPAMRYLVDTYIRADDSEKISAFDDLNLVQLIVERGPEAVEALPERIKKNEESVAETIENNVRKLIINESPIDPAYYDQMSKLLDALIEQRRKKAVDYREYLVKIAELSKHILQPHGAHSGTLASIKTAAQKALYNNLWQDEGLALQMDGAIRGSSRDDWKTNTMKTKLVRKAIRTVLEPALAAKAAEGFTGVQDSGLSYTLEAEATRLLELAKNQHDY
jgi:type I restriction enzyme R subunit